MNVSACVLRVALLAVLPSLVVPTPSSAQDAPTPPPAVPIEPVAAILDAFRAHNIVALGESHGNEQIHAFRLRLLRDPRFAATVNDIVVECGSARYQDLMDRFIRGEDDALLYLGPPWNAWRCSDWVPGSRRTAPR